MENFEQLTKELIEEKIKSKNIVKLREIFDFYNLVDIADLLNCFENMADLIFIFKTVPASYTSDVFTYLDPEIQEQLINAFTNEQIKEMLNELFSDDIVDFLEEMPANLVRKILQSADKEMRAEINHLLNYKPSSAGSIMTTEYVEIKEEDTCKDAMNKIRLIGRDAVTISYLFVVDSMRHLIGTIVLQELLFANENQSVTEIMETDFVHVITSFDQEEVAQVIKRYDISSVAVTNEDLRMVGVITVDDIIDVIDDEATEDIQKMAAIAPLEDGYMKTTVFVMAKKRVVWLLVLMVSATFTGLIINSYQATLSLLPILSMFIPMLMDTAGNSGGQTSTLVIRGLALGEVHLKDYPKVLKKELCVALVAGGFLSLISFIWIFIQFKVGIISTEGLNGVAITDSTILITSLLVSISLLCTVVLAKGVGSTLPILAKKLGLDPALMAGPLVTTIVDAISLSVYFILATKIFGSILGIA